MSSRCLETKTLQVSRTTSLLSCVQASSAPIDRFLSQSGIIITLARTAHVSNAGLWSR